MASIPELEMVGRRITTVLLLVAALTGCAGHRHVASAQEPTDSHQNTKAHAAFQWHEPAPQLTPVARASLPEDNNGLRRVLSNWLSAWMRGQDLQHYNVQDLHFPAVGENGQPDNMARLRYYRGDAPAPRPLLIIMPIWGSFDYPSEQVAWLVRDRFAGTVDIAMLEGEQRLLRWEAMAQAETEADLRREADRSAERLRVNVVDTRRLIDWAEANPEIDNRRIALAGFSMGALVASIVASNDPRPAATVVVMGGARPDAILGYCNRAAGDTREAVLANLDMDLDEYRAIMRDSFDLLDAVHYSGRVDPATVLMVEAKDDTCMPQESRQGLWQALNQPHLISVNGGHEWAFLSMTPLNLNRTSHHIVDFLEQRFDTAPAGSWMVERQEKKPTSTLTALGSGAPH